MVTELNVENWISDDDGKSRNECKDTGWVVIDSYQIFIGIVILNVDLKTMQIRNVKKFVLPCRVSEGGCASTSLDVEAYTWKEPEYCLFKKFRSVYNDQMIKFNEQYFISTDPKSNLDNPNFFLEILIISKKFEFVVIHYQYTLQIMMIFSFITLAVSTLILVNQRVRIIIILLLLNFALRVIMKLILKIYSMMYT